MPPSETEPEKTPENPIMARGGFDVSSGRVKAELPMSMPFDPSKVH